MAVCEIWDVRGRLDHPIDYAVNPEKTKNMTAKSKYTSEELQALSDVIKYAANEKKTEKQYFVSGINCSPDSAREEMNIVKKQFTDESKIICYHGYQSFPDGEGSPEIVHEIGIRLAKKMWGDRFQVVVATHLNTNCLHNHFVVNSISFKDGMHYHDNKENLKKLRDLSDDICREYGLSVIKKQEGRKKAYALYQAEKNGLPTRDTVARQAIDEAISMAFTLKDFHKILSDMGYRCCFVPNRKYWTIQGKGWQRPKRLYKLGEDYTNERILERLKENTYSVKFSKFEERGKRAFYMKERKKSKNKIGGLRGLYIHYCFCLGILPKNRKVNYARLHYLLKDDLMKMDTIAKETRLLCRYRIDTEGQLFSYEKTLLEEKENLLSERKRIYADFRKSKEKSPKDRERLSAITKRLKKIREEVRLCEGIEKRSNHIKENLTVIQEEHRKEREEHEHRRRRSRANR